ncbi:dihydrolipoamide dehydrogenase precursor [Purpureocillium lavendulum]|uniref:Dihydrolipoamide dehydrogenase n=1 Tax=Purpureocillium lavendulum TaxID=1247861 RepID=A0AB34FQ03_9HYPO|nr:dihydrolipoamide dehydrogenase precursor [Purpureocillium lavendulum]
MRGYDDLEGDQRHSIRRFTTLEGWRDVRLGLQLAAGSTLSTIIANPAYDQEWHLSDDRRAQVYPPRSLPIGAFQDSSDLGHLGCGHNRQLPPEKVLSKNADDRAVWSKSHTSFSLELKGCEIAEANKSKGCENSERPLPQTPFHSFTRKEKWLVVITIGVAGLFSNLSSYIYYLALDDIAELLAEKDISVSLVFGGTVYTIWGMVVDSTTPIFKRRFRLDDLDLGLIMLPNGFGTILGPVLAGKVMTHDFQTFEKAYLPENPSAAPPSESKACLPLDFPIEHARLRHVPCVLAVFALATGAYGFTVLPAEHLPLVLKPGWIAVPLILQFIIATTSSAIFAMIATLVTDLCPGQGASSTAVNNLVRCSMGALGSATVDLMIEALGTSMTFLMERTDLEFEDGLVLDLFSPSNRTMVVTNNGSPLPGHFVTGSSGEGFINLSPYSWIVKLNETANDLIAKIELPYSPSSMRKQGVDISNTYVGVLSNDKKSWVVSESQRNVHVSRVENKTRIIKMTWLDGEYMLLGRKSEDITNIFVQYGQGGTRTVNATGGNGVQEGEFIDGLRFTIKSSGPFTMNVDIPFGVSAAALPQGARSLNSFTWTVNTTIPSKADMIVEMRVPFSMKLLTEKFPRATYKNLAVARRNSKADQAARFDILKSQEVMAAEDRIKVTGLRDIDGQFCNDHRDDDNYELQRTASHDDGWICEYFVELDKKFDLSRHYQLFQKVEHSNRPVPWGYKGSILSTTQTHEDVIKLNTGRIDVVPVRKLRRYEIIDSMGETVNPDQRPTVHV